MGSIEKFIDAMKLTESRKAGVEKAMHSLLVEWKNLESADSSAQQFLQDCFADIQLRRDQLNSMQESITNRKKELDEIAKSSKRRLEEVKKREKDFRVMCEEKSKEFAFGKNQLNLMKELLDKGTKDLDLKYKIIHRKENLIEEVYEKFRLERIEFERIKGVIDERFEEVKLKEKNIEISEMELLGVIAEVDEKLKIVVAKENDFELREKDINNRQIKLDRVRNEVHEIVKTAVEKEKELVEKDIENRQIRLDRDKTKVDGIMKKLEEKEKYISLKEEDIKMREQEMVSFQNLMEKKIDGREKCCVSKEKTLHMIEEMATKRENELEIKERNFKEWVKIIDAKEKEIESKEKNFESIINFIEKKIDEVQNREEQCFLKEKKVVIDKEEIDKRAKMLKCRENWCKERMKMIDLKDKEISSRDVLIKERCVELESRENRLLDQQNEFELKGKHFKECEKEIHSAERIFGRERCKKIDSKENNISGSLIALNMKEQHIQNCIKSFEAEKEQVNSFRISCEEIYRKLILEQDRFQHQIKELEEKNKQCSNVGHSVVKLEPWTDDRSYADIRLCAPMNGLELLLYLIDHKRDLDSMNDEVFRALGLSMDPGKLVLDAMQQFYQIKADKNFEEDVVCRSSIIMLEQLRRRTSQIPPRRKRAALKLATEWKSLMKSSLEFIAFLQLLASYGLGSAYKPEEFLSNFEVLDQHIQKVELCHLLGYTERVTDIIEVMLKDQQHVKAVRYVCAFGLCEKFQPASLLKDFMKNAQEKAKTLCEDKHNSVNNKDKAYDNIVASLYEAVYCIKHCKLESEYSSDCITRFIQKLIEEKNDDKYRLSGSNNDEQDEVEKDCISDIPVPDPTITCTKSMKKRKIGDMAMDFGKI